ncbi:MAG: TIGR00341 family protein, partial [Elainellaceae cyanobacterium]
MRQLLVSVPVGEGSTVIDMAQAHAGVNLARFKATDAHDPIELVLIHVSNQQVEGLLHQLETIPDMRVTLLPAAVMALY